MHHFSDVNRTLLLEAGAALNLSKGTTLRLLDNLRDRMAQEAQSLYDDVEAANAHTSKERPDLSTTMTGELRCLRSILYNIINEMVKRLG